MPTAESFYIGNQVEMQELSLPQHGLGSGDQWSAPVEVENFLNVLPEHKNITFPSSDCESQRRNF